jgi:hypothetical protein
MAQHLTSSFRARATIAVFSGVEVHKLVEEMRRLLFNQFQAKML